MKAIASTREARDSFFLIGVVLLTIAPHLPRLPLWASGLALALLAWRAWLAAGARPLPSRWLLVALLVAAVAGTKLSHGVVLGRQPGLTLVCLLMAMKLLEMHARRDAFVVFFLGFFLVLAQYLHSQSLWVALWTIAAVWGLLTSLVLSQMPLGQPSLKLASREAARSTLLGLPLMVLLFLLFPRIGPLWGLPQDALGKTGLSGTMRMGGVAEVANDDAIAFRVRFEGRAPADNQLYFRGPVLSRFDGVEWKQGPLPRPGSSYRADMALELRNRDRERKLIKKIDETLGKIKEGEYGYCNSCGVEIGLKRLEARPTATLCIDCKTLDEIRERQVAR